MSYTPGPWNLEESDRAPEFVFGGDTCVCDFGIEAPKPEDARLIAAAPELYEELREMLYYARCVYEQNGGDDEQRGLAPKIKKDIDRIEALLRRVDPEEDEHHDQP